LQEGLSNIQSHAQASEVWVDLRQSAEKLELTIRDNGIGFDRNAVSGDRGLEGSGLGLFGMQIRAKRVGGTVEVKSKPGAGTELLAFFPLDIAAD
jgi:two-component system NarL family sensor kinase